MEAANRFDHIEHMPLRVYNRVVMMYNIREDAGESGLKAYLENFNDDERKQMFLMNAYVIKEGVKKAQEFVTKGLKIEYSVDEEEDVSG